MTTALVASTSLETGRFSPRERSVARDEPIKLIDRLFTLDEGYIEVRIVADDFPALLVGFRHGLAVVQRMSDPDSMSLLVGDGSVGAQGLAKVIIFDDLATYSGEYVVRTKRAQEVLAKFACDVDLDSLGEWHEL